MAKRAFTFIHNIATELFAQGAISSFQSLRTPLHISSIERYYYCLPPLPGLIGYFIVAVAHMELG